MSSISVLCSNSGHVPKWPGYYIKNECFALHNTHMNGNFIFIISDSISIHLQTHRANKNSIAIIVSLKEEMSDTNTLFSPANYHNAS